MRQNGLTLIELLTSLLVATLLLSIGVPSLSQQLHTNRTRVATQEIYDALQLTRAHAVQLNRRVTLRHTGSWTSGWEAFVDSNNNGVRDHGERLLFSGGALHGAHITPNTPVSHYVSFIGTGESRFVGSASSGGFQAGSFTVCSAAGDTGFSLVLARSGRVRQSPAPSDACASP